MTLRIYFVGAHSTGKTTLARHVSDKYDIPMLSEVARQVLGSMEKSLDEIRANVKLADDFQRRIFTVQCETEKAADSFVADRAFDNLAYAAEHSRVASGIFDSRGFYECVERLRTSLVFFVRPHEALLREDGVRNDLEWGAVCRIDGAIRMLLEVCAIPYFTVADKSMVDRVRLVEGIVNLEAERQRRVQ